MNGISTAAQALIDRLACLNPARPRHDKAAIERSLSAFLAALGLTNRPIVWVDDAISAYRMMATRDRQEGPALGRKAQIKIDAEQAVVTAESDGRDIYALEAMFAAQQAAMEVARLGISGPIDDLTRIEGLDASRREFAREDAIAAVAWGAANDAMRHPAIAKAATVFRHLFEAFEAGLCLYWVTAEDIVCVPQPALSIVNGALQREDGPAILWPSGQGISLRNGRIVPKPEKIRPEAQHLLDRALRLDFSAPRIDRPAAERAMSAFLEMLGQPLRPILWTEGPRAGFQHLQDRLTAQADALNLDETSDWSQIHSTDEAFGRAQGVLRDQINTARGWGDSTAADLAAEGVLLPDIWSFDLDMVVHNAAMRSGATTIVRKLGERIIQAPVSVPQPQPIASHAAAAIGDTDLLPAQPQSEQDRLARAWLPMFEAFEAGLAMFWITPEAAICIPRPALSVQAGQLHRSDGPAVKWPSGEAYYFYRNTLVPRRLIETPETITIETIHAEPNPSVRRCAAERYGVARYLRDSNARLVHQEDHCRLWEISIGKELWRIVEAEERGLQAGQPRPTTLLWSRMRWEQPAFANGEGGWTLVPPR